MIIFIDEETTSVEELDEEAQLEMEMEARYRQEEADGNQDERI